MHKILFWVAITLLLLSGCGSNGEDADCAEGYQDNDADGVCELDCAHTDICGNYACDDSSGIAICECSYSEPESFRKYTGRIGDVYVVGNLAYTTYEVGSYSSSTSSGLHIFDISNTTAPNYVGSIAMPGQALKVVVSDQIAYVAGAESGLQIIDVSTPSSPVMQGTWETNDSVMAVAVVGGTAYVANGLSGLAIVDVSNSEAPALLGKYDTTGFAVNVAVQEQTAFVADLHGGLQIIDVSDPTNPVLLDVYMMPDVQGDDIDHDGKGKAYDVAVSGNIVYVVDKFGPMQILDVSTPSMPVFLSECNIPANGIFLNNQTVFLTNNSYLFTADISDPINSVYITHYETPDKIAGIFVQNQKAYIGNNRAGLNIFYISNPASPEPIGNTGTMLDSAVDFFISDEMVYIADVRYYEEDADAEQLGEDHSLKILSVSNPSQPVLVGSIPIQDNKKILFYNDGIVYILIDEIGLEIVDVSNPANPAILATIEYSYYSTNYLVFWDVFVLNDLAYFTSFPDTIRIYDVSDPSVPTLLSETNTQIGVDNIFVRNSVAYIHGFKSFQALDVSDPLNPTILGNYRLPNEALAFFVNDKTAFFACNEEGVNIVDVSDPSEPDLVGEFDTNGRAVDIFVSEQTAYVADTVQGLLILDVSVPSDPVLLGKYNRGGTINKVFVSDGKVYVIDSEFGLDILEVMTCTCDEGFTGENCDECAEGYTGYPDCTRM